VRFSFLGRARSSHQAELHSGTSVTGFPPASVTGTQHIADAWRRKRTTAYTDAATSPAISELTGQNLGRKNLTPGIYTFSASAQLPAYPP
jgi:hypothetical protein